MTVATRNREAQHNDGADQTGAAEPRVITFGCRLNAYESEVMLRQARAAGLGEAVIVNTCAVTAEAERQARQAIRKAKRENPEAEIVVAGCAAQLDPDGFAAMPEVGRVLGNEAKLRPDSYAPDHAGKIVVDDIMEARETASHLLGGFETRTRAFVQIQQGCDHRCTFCIIPYARGNNRSVPVGELVRQVRLLVENGVREVVLTGVDITDYGKDLPGQPTLGQLSRRLLSLVPDLPRLRLSSVDPVELDDDVYRLLADEPRLMPHLHLSLQAGDDLILKRMKRRHLMADARSMVTRARRMRPDVVFGADLIAGFPTESDAAFENTLAAVAELDLTFLHVFPYSERPGTPAARMPAVEKAVRKARAAKLREKGAEAVRRFLDASVGSTASVLLEEADEAGRMKGRTEHFAPVRVAGGQVGEAVRVRITGIEENHLVAEALA
ncbi:tRNA (N(6)-L-threonylcarbamoyladenosine(37)-C(2))-methylthiotransferase MtaB [Ferruginivarius sediminum]|uniref:tRNA (N(6)-L-threonylcarbamoyladenosine(37)-C(2))-methylthiotransferase n=1 Tax=Ferruginivarius sediminum TaxID=2661937 RepID=A0A369TDR8_9PROT|nr:tRNA (N(6)-L-threonylcarbamoyladenosine(37)-C(2))-methylthiotransferase MtaB [Ferruginivarius sediminum]RDD63501.1 tRNA (N(6)-L-threonylcarbamoyladenosine(37)-C(2))-methylthiotransferase MtaB [Ferruginivarius sediminum]